jgi:hypothetical protein
MWERRQILDEFTRVTGYHRKHALRVLHRPFVPQPARPRKWIYDEAVRQALALLWEAADRICGKRLKALLLVLIESMERHGHSQLDPVVRSGLLHISAATIDRLLRPVGEASGRIRGAAGDWARRSGRACRCGLLMIGANRRRATARPIWSNTVAPSMKASSYTV